MKYNTRMGKIKTAYLEYRKEYKYRKSQPVRGTYWGAEGIHYTDKEQWARLKCDNAEQIGKKGLKDVKCKSRGEENEFIYDNSKK